MLESGLMLRIGNRVSFPLNYAAVCTLACRELGDEESHLRHLRLLSFIYCRISYASLAVLYSLYSVPIYYTR